MDIGGHDRRRRYGTSEAHRVLEIATPGKRPNKICFRQPPHALLRRRPLLADGGSMQINVGKRWTVARALRSVPAVRRRSIRHASSIRHSARAQMSGEYEPLAQTSTTDGMPIFASPLPKAD